MHTLFITNNALSAIYNMCAYCLDNLRFLFARNILHLSSKKINTYL